MIPPPVGQGDAMQTPLDVALTGLVLGPFSCRFSQSRSAVPARLSHNRGAGRSGVPRQVVG